MGLRATQNDVPPSDCQKKEAHLAPDGNDALPRRSAEFPGQDARRHPDGIVLPAIISENLHEAETTTIETTTNQASPQRHSQKKPELGEDVELILDLLVRRTKRGGHGRGPPSRQIRQLP